MRSDAQISMTRRGKNKETIFLATIVLFIGGIAGAASAPKLELCGISSKKDLGTWDDAFLLEDQDRILLRRGSDLFFADGTNPESPVKVASIKESVASSIVAGASLESHHWIFFESTKESPFAFDLDTGKRIPFVVAKSTRGQNQGGTIQAFVIAAHAGGALLMLSRGGARSWPRPENRPIFFWINLTSGEVIRMPVGWDLEYFSADEEIAIFETPQRVRFERRPTAALSMATGKAVISYPTKASSDWIPFDWGYKSGVRPLNTPLNPKTGDQHYLGGVSSAGTPYKFEKDPDGNHHLSAAKSDGKKVIYSIRDSGAVAPSSLWWAPLDKSPKPIQLCDRPIEFEFLGSHSIAYLSASGTGHTKRIEEGFVYDTESASTWNILDDVPRLKELPEEVSKKPNILDNLSGRLVHGFGKSNAPPLVLAIFDHSRIDMSAAPSTVHMDTVKDEHWQKSILLQAEGKRCAIAELQLPVSGQERLWLHNSGNLFIAEQDWTKKGSHSPMTRLSLVAFDLERIRGPHN